MDPNANTEENPAAAIANAAMNGATPVVTTTDPTASDVAPEPTLQVPEPAAPAAPVLDTSVLDASALAAPAAPAAPAPAPEAPAEGGPVSLAPSADFQMGAVSTVSAVQNGQDGNLAATTDEVMIGQPLEQNDAPVENPTEDQNIDQLQNTEVAPETQNPSAQGDFNNPEENTENPEDAIKTFREEIKDDPLIAAAPVPGSIGSAKSYADIQRAEAEKAAKVAEKQGKKGFTLNKNTIIIIAIAVVAVIGIGVGAFVLLGGGSSQPAQTTTPTVAPVEEEHDYSTLSCKRNLALEEYVSYGAISGQQENIFYFEDDTLDGLVTNFSYTYASKALADVWRDKLALDYGVTPNNGVDEESAVKRDADSEEEGTEAGDESEEAGTKTTAEMLQHYVNTKDLTVIHGMMIKSEDIKAWLASDAYSDVTYGATSNGAAAPVSEGEEESEEETVDADGEVIRNLKYYNRLQNSIDYTCSISKGY